MSIQKLSPTTTRRLSSSQTISSVCDAVKELVENALDSGATSINVKLVNYGLDSIEVQDNGCGVPVSQVENMCLPHCTSKIREFSDLGSTLETYGFRGQALASLCNIADVQITTRTVDDDYASVFTFDKNGKIVDSNPSHFVKGTTVSVCNIFNNLPVRKKFMSSSNKSKSELKKTEVLVKNFAIVNSGIYFSFGHNRSMEWCKSPAKSLKESAKSVLGYTVGSHLEEVTTVHKKSTIVLVVPNRQSKALATLCYANVDVVRIFINRRPVKYNKLQKLALKCVLEYFGSNFPQGKYPTCILSIQMPPSDIDVNIEANKMKVICREEDELLVAVEKLFQSYYKHDNLGNMLVIEKEQNEIPTVLQCKQKSSHATRNEVGQLLVNQLPINNSEINKKTDSASKPDLLTVENEDLWSLADSAMGFTNKGCVKSASGDVIKVTVEKGIGDKEAEEEICAKRFCLDRERDNQSICSEPTHQMIKTVSDKDDSSHVINAVVDQQLLLPLNENPRDLIENSRIKWSRGCVQSSLGNIIDGGATLLQPKSNSNVEVVTKTAQDKHKSNLGTEKVDQKVSKKFNSSFHTVSSQMGCKEMSGFTNFCREKRPEILHKKPGMLFTSVAQELANEWQKLSPEEQASYGKIKEYSKPTKINNCNRSILNPTSLAQNKSLKDMFEKSAVNANELSTTQQIDSNNDCEIATVPKKHAMEYMEYNNKQEPKNFEMLHCLLPEELWICKRGFDIGIIRPWCLQEKVLFTNFMRSYSVPVVPLDKPLLLRPDDFVRDLWQLLTSMDTEETVTKVVEIVSPFVTKNGLRLHWKDDKLYMTHVASTIRYYGIEELREILVLLKVSTDLSQCRPVKVSAFLESEAVRLANLKNSPMNKEKITKLVELWNSEEDNLCLHQKPILKFLFTLPSDEC